MFFYLSKLLGYLLNPLAWVIVLLFCAVIVRKPVKKKRFTIFALLLLLIFTNPFLGDEAIRAWEKPLVKRLSGSYNAGIVLGGDIVSYDKPSDRVIFRSGADRLLQAVELYKKKNIKKIIISGGSGHLIYRDRTEASFIKKYLINIGIESNDILVENKSKNTFENARFTAKLLQQNDSSDSLLLITSSLHMRRASGCFEKQSIAIREYPTAKITGDRLKNIDHLLIPSIKTLEQWNLLIHELLGYAMYKVMGYC
ncbi:MAG: YdcF family protein [Chloroflexota bacterium]|nr:YdcF family protein [Lentimicrobium sp.]